jgi:hypothetical protein
VPSLATRPGPLRAPLVPQHRMPTSARLGRNEVPSAAAWPRITRAIALASTCRGGVGRPEQHTSAPMVESSARSSQSSARTGHGGHARSPIPYCEGSLAYDPPVFCHSNLKAPKWISWSDDNSGQRYYRCRHAWVRSDIMNIECAAFAFHGFQFLIAKPFSLVIRRPRWIVVFMFGSILSKLSL